MGDVHGNADALRVVLTSAQEMGVEHLLITGDLVGYYFAPAEVMELLKSWPKHIVRGNHEAMLAALRKDPALLDSIAGRYGSGVQLALEQLCPSQLNELCMLPHPLTLELDGCRVLLCHGAPWDVEQYVYPDAVPDLLQRCFKPEIDFVVLGHTHYPMVRQIGAARIINPGSVGQPRNRQPGAQWAFLDTESRRVELRVEQYDRAPLIRECLRRHPELPYLAEILERM